MRNQDSPGSFPSEYVLSHSLSLVGLGCLSVSFRMILEEGNRQSSGSSRNAKSAAKTSGQMAVIHRLKRDRCERNNTIKTSKTLFRHEVA